MTNSAKSPREIHANQPYDKMDPIDENTLDKLEPEIEIDKVEQETLETESLEGLSDSGIYRHMVQWPLTNNIMGDYLMSYIIETKKVLLDCHRK